MKTMIRLIAIGATVAMLALPGASRNLLPPPDTFGQDQCTPENKDAWYATFRETFKTDQQPKAYEAAKKYLTACAAEETDITKYLKRWVGAYEKEIRKVRLPQLLYGNDKKYPEAYALGREILTDDPENLKVLIDLGANGYLVAPLKNQGLNADALTYAQKAIQLLDSGKTVENWQPFSGKDEALAYLHYTAGALSLEKDPAAALPHLIKAVQYETQLKKSPLPYAYIGGAYESGPYAKQSEDYKKFQGKDETPESKLALANINQIVDRMIDAYARAVAAAGNDPRYQAGKPQWVESLTTWYKYRHNQSDAGMNDMVASILSKPLPPEPTPLTALPAPAATPGGNSGSGLATGTNSGVAPDRSISASANAPSGTTQPATKTTTAATGTSKPAGAKTSSASGPNKPRNNHKRN